MDRLLVCLVIALVTAGRFADGLQQNTFATLLAFDHQLSGGKQLAEHQQYRSLPTKSKKTAAHKKLNKTSAVPAAPQFRQLELIEDEPLTNGLQHITGEIFNGASTAIQTVADAAMVPIKSFGGIFSGIYSSLQGFAEMLGVPNLLSGIGSVFESIGLTSLFNSIGSALAPIGDKVVETLDYVAPIWQKIFKFTRPLQMILALEDDFLPFLKIFRLTAFVACIWDNKYGFIHGIGAGLKGFGPCVLQGIGLIPGFGTLTNLVGLVYDTVTYFTSGSSDASATVAAGTDIGTSYPTGSNGHIPGEM